jgi:CRP-like cAMP-binding protein
MFFIVSGLVRICRSVTDSTVERSDREDDLKLCDVVVTKLCSGEMFGESAVMPASLGTFQCTVQCETAVKCFRVDKAQLDLEMFREGGALLEEVKKASVTYPDDSILLQMFLDQKRSTAMRIKVMKEMEGTLKQRDRKKEKRR